MNLDLAASVLLTENMVEKTIADEGALPYCHKSNRDRESESGGIKAARFKTTVRRLYDIANVLTSLGLICKVQNTENSGRKPAFKYTGPSVEAALFTGQGESNVILHHVAYIVINHSVCTIDCCGQQSCMFDRM